MHISIIYIFRLLYTYIQNLLLKWQHVQYYQMTMETPVLEPGCYSEQYFSWALYQECSAQTDAGMRKNLSVSFSLLAMAVENRFLMTN